MTKKIMFQGSEYVVSDWAKYIAMDGDGSIFCYSKKPEIYFDGAQEYWHTNLDGEWELIKDRVVNEPVCEEIK